ncbi:hypothetical protein FEE95_11780 [Maribacter algarum]|uniref:Uncharacterized protein n=1 Tax=Maribacter algarum (ex Zhang et al. 2020) TaxID=2578118 RepID=A0A5S3PR45_9FLAO|nr:hypothetical protein [Maribacter algarum]TMM57164.1 hypothetical protein FEE95_11780 [Maribacter algarum]
MRNCLLILILIGNCSISFGQDAFANALASLNLELEFQPKTDSYTTSNKPNQDFVTQFEKCADYEKLERLSELDFDLITKVKCSDLITSKWEGKWQIEFREWEFESESCATDFMSTLDSLQHNRIQVCVSKGGIMWLRDENKIYLVTSGAYFVTYHYKEIKSAIIEGLKK